MKSQWVGLVGDVGGTNARFALVDAQGHVRHPRIFTCRQYASLADVIAEYIDTTAGKKCPPRAVIAVAGPVLDGEIALARLLNGQAEEHAVTTHYTPPPDTAHDWASKAVR